MYRSACLLRESALSEALNKQHPSSLARLEFKMLFKELLCLLYSLLNCEIFIIYAYGSLLSSKVITQPEATNCFSIQVNFSINFQVNNMTLSH